VKKELKLVPLGISAGWKLHAKHVYMMNLDE